MPDAMPSVFISYGRKDASRFVDRLAADLTHAGFRVWRDTTDLRAPHPWQEQLVAALDQSDMVIAVLTPHAVRTGSDSAEADESVCLDELAYARFSAPPTPIVPIMLQFCDPPFVIYRLNYLDFTGADQDEARYAATSLSWLRPSTPCRVVSRRPIGEPVSPRWISTSISRRRRGTLSDAIGWSPR
jgi:hypothetical protein